MLAKDIFIKQNEIVLVDGDNTNADGEFYGGIQYIGETLDNFLGEIELDFDTITVHQLFTAMNNENVWFENIEKSIDWKKLMQLCCNHYEHLMSAMLKELLNEDIDIIFADFDY